MHELFTKVLSKRDLSRAGDLFSVSDSEIVEYLTQVVSMTYSHIRLLISKQISILEQNRNLVGSGVNVG